ncbi:MAG: BlaI/MecI/CopY family transcriptional regulator [Candidatus Woesebacteria bacterium]
MQQKALSPLEQEVMNIVWQLQECSIRDVMEKLNQDKKLAYTTIATLLQRLLQKGFVCRNTESSVLSYTPKVSKERYSSTMATSFVHNFLSSFGETAIVSFADSIDTLPKDKKEYLLKLLEKHHED